jgi:hypothetical protein
MVLLTNLQAFIKIQGAEAPLQLGEEKALRDPRQLLQALLGKLEGEEPLGVSVDDVPKSG